MAHQVKRIATVVSSLLASATALSTPKPFDPDVARAIVDGTPFVVQTDEEVVLTSISSCSPLTTPGLRLCQEQPLNLPDTDARIDMIVGVNNTSPKRFYSGRSPGLFNPAQFFGIPARTSGIKLADLDADGDLDMVETVRADDGDTTNMVYVNRSGTRKSLFEDEQALDSSKHDRSSSVALGDVNNDGKLDVVIGNEAVGGHEGTTARTNYLYLNNTTTPNSVVFGAALPLDAAGTEKYTRRVLLIDVEGDGDLDLVATAANTSADEAGVGNLLYVNQTVGGTVAAGTNPFAAPVQLSADAADDTDVANAIAAGDLDGDGDPDLVFSTWSRMSGAAAVAATNRYYINNSTAGNISFATGTFGSGAHHTNVRLADFDKDGDLDVLSVVLDGKNVLHRNVGGTEVFGPGIELVTPAGLTVDRSRGLDVADINGDTYADVVIVNRDQVGLRYLNNAGAAGLAHPFANDGPSIIAQSSTAVVPPGGAPITFGQTQLAALNVEDTDNVYPTDFKALVTAPVATAEYTCTVGVITGNPLENDNCIGGQITPKPGAETNGTIGPISIRVSDGEANSGRLTTFMLTVGTGSAPTFTTSTLPDADEDAATPLYSATITASDAQGDSPLTFAAVNPLPAWLSLVNDTATTVKLNATTAPLQGDVGQHPITLRVSDAGGLSSTQNFTLTVKNVNDKPSVTTTTLPDGAQNQPYSTTVTATDEDGTAPTFVTPATGLPTGLALSADGVISGTPTVSGTFQVVLQASDSALTSDAVTVPLTIAAATGNPPPPPPGNRAPVFTAPGPQSGTVGTAFNLSLAGSATDADGDAMTFAATGLPPGITLSTAGLLSGSPTTASGSPFTVAVTVSDGKGGTANGSFQFAVSNPTSGNSGGDSGGGGGSLGFLEVLALFGMGTLAGTRRRRVGAGR